MRSLFVLNKVEEHFYKCISFLIINVVIIIIKLRFREKSEKLSGLVLVKLLAL